MRPVTLNPNNPQAALREIERASHEADLTEIAQNFSVRNAPGAQRTFNGASVQLSTAGIGNGADTTDDTLFSYTLPANALAMVGSGLEIEAFGTFASNGNNKRARLFFGSIAQGTGIVTSAGIAWRLHMKVFKTGSSLQLAIFDGLISATATNLTITMPNQTDTAPIVIMVTGASPTSGAANDVVGNGLIVGPILPDIADTFATFIADCQKGGMNRTT